MSKGQSAFNLSRLYACGHGSSIDRIIVSGQVFINELIHISPNDGIVGYFDASQYSILSDPYLVSFMYVRIPR